MHLLKHALDRVVGLAALPWAIPPMLLIGACIKLEDVLAGEGAWASVLYRERRFSAGREFELFKFRVLRPSALAELRRRGDTTIKGAEHEEGVTRVGRLLIRYYLDELPQLLHVLSGTMSLVGPRPVWPHDSERRVHFAKHRIKSGLAGTFQLAKGTGDIFELDKLYVREYLSRSQLSLLAYDARVLLRTLRKMTRGEGL